MFSFRGIVLLVGAMVWFGADWLPAQDFVLGQKYGYGVHAYFAGDYAKAYGQLSAAIEGGSKDPRAYYFRGLACLELGRQPEAQQDFQKGAELESKDLHRFYNVSKALERIQGAMRIELENYRFEARMTALEEAERLRKARYEAIRREETRVLREQPPAPPEAIATPQPTVEKPAAPTAEPATDPFAVPSGKPATKAEDKAPTKSVKAPANKPAAKPAAASEENPFAAPPAKSTTPTEKTKEAPKSPASGKPAAKPSKPAEEENPFLDDKPAEKKPTKEEKKPVAEKKTPAAEEKKPVAEKKAPAEAKGKPAEKKAADKKAVEDDPFAPDAK